MQIVAPVFSSFSFQLEEKCEKRQTERKKMKSDVEKVVLARESPPRNETPRLTLLPESVRTHTHSKTYRRRRKVQLCFTSWTRAPLTPPPPPPRTPRRRRQSAEIVSPLPELTLLSPLLLLRLLSSDENQPAAAAEHSDSSFDLVFIPPRFNSSKDDTRLTEKQAGGGRRRRRRRRRKKEEDEEAEKEPCRKSVLGEGEGK